ncbi:MAG: hypothetical protein HUK26_05600, partial [Duodenibacillus sp.]|nr:hypothetical protein [Duodenibacillus sp.]
MTPGCSRLRSACEELAAAFPEYVALGTPMGYERRLAGAAENGEFISRSELCVLALMAFRDWKGRGPAYLQPELWRKILGLYVKPVRDPALGPRLCRVLLHGLLEAWPEGGEGASCREDVRQVIAAAPEVRYLLPLLSDEAPQRMAARYAGEPFGDFLFSVTYGLASGSSGFALRLWREAEPMLLRRFKAALEDEGVTAAVAFLRKCLFQDGGRGLRSEAPDAERFALAALEAFSGTVMASRELALLLDLAGDMQAAGAAAAGAAFCSLRAKAGGGLWQGDLQLLLQSEALAAAGVPLPEGHRRIFLEAARQGRIREAMVVIGGEVPEKLAALAAFPAVKAAGGAGGKAIGPALLLGLPGRRFVLDRASDETAYAGPAAEFNPSMAGACWRVRHGVQAARWKNRGCEGRLAEMLQPGEPAKEAASLPASLGRAAAEARQA